MTRPLHIVFSLSAAGSLREGLDLAGRDEEVIGLADNWAVGPIDSEVLTPRLAAVREMEDIDFDPEERDGIERFWQTALAAARPRIVWLSRWSTLEYCGFLEWLRRNGGAPFTLVDLNDISIPDREDPARHRTLRFMGLLNGQDFADNALWDLAASPPPEHIAAWMVLWNRLRNENTAFRVITNEGLVSALITHFDPEILGQVRRRRWRSALQIVGHILADHVFPNDHSPGIHQCGDLPLFARVRALIEQGALEVQGDPYDLHFKVRLAQSTYAATAPTA